MTPNSPLVSTQWLAGHLSAPDVRVADASWYLPQAGRDAKAEYEAAHIPRAVFFDIDDLSDEKSPYPHMLALAQKFASRMRRLGLGDGNLMRWKRHLFFSGPLICGGIVFIDKALHRIAQ